MYLAVSCINRDLVFSVVWALDSIEKSYVSMSVLKLLMSKHVLLFIPVIPQLYKSLDSLSFQLKSSWTRVFNTSPGIYHDHGKIKAIARMHLQLHLMHLQSQQQGMAFRLIDTTML